MPAVSMATLRRSLPRDLDARFGDIVYFSDAMAPRHEFLTADSRTPYVLTVFDLRSGPMVLEVPPASDRVALSGSAVDSWQVPLADLGSAGEDAGRGGRYLFLPPDHCGERPEDFIVVPSPTAYVHIALCAVAGGTTAPADAVAHSRRLRAYPLRDAAGPRPNRYVDAFPRAWRTLPKFDIGCLELLAEVVDDEPWQARDAVMAGMLASLGIEKGRPFEPEPEQAHTLARAVREADAHIREWFAHRTLAPHWPGRHWMALGTASTRGFSYHGDGRLDYDRRAAFFSAAAWAPKRPAESGSPTAPVRLSAFRDAAGQPFRSDGLYRVRLPADTPSRDGWSVTAYDAGTNAFIANPLDRVGVSSRDRDELALNPDGSVDVYAGARPLGGLEANWIPTAGRDFWLMCRFHGPERPLLDRTWVLDDAVEIG
jgi:hypothetical protein